MTLESALADVASHALGPAVGGAIGLLIGLERERCKGQGPGRRQAGLDSKDACYSILGASVVGNAIKVGIQPQLLDTFESLIPLGRAGTPEEAAGAVYLLCTPESDYISGQVIVAGGGLLV